MDLFLYLLFDSGSLKLTVWYEGYMLIIQILCKLSDNRTDSEPPSSPKSQSPCLFLQYELLLPFTIDEVQ